ncbi:MAG: hypothetical protein BAJATHORv1_40205 [Candidatus Thorarchaeota archaeon]|nr:MAG: hypothetical protein BAJATHORv1_40205 [Candidatus Thorarchaeota archaeon]
MVNDDIISDDFDEGMYLDILRDDPPLKRYVSRGDTPDDVDISGPHEEADAAISRVIRFTKSDETPRFQPVLGSAGMGKTHLFWVTKDREEYMTPGPFLTVYVPSPPSPIRVPLHFYACLVDEAGDNIFKTTARMLLEKFGEMKGVFRQHYDFSEVMNKAASDYPGISADVVKVILRYELDEKKKPLARRWLLADALSDEELDELDVRTILEEDDIVTAAFKLLAEGSERPLVLFVDEMEGPFNTHGEEGERQFLEVIKRLYNECQNVVIIASCLSEIWDRIYHIADAPMRSRMETPVTLRHFSRDDVEEFVRETMIRYWEEQNIDTPTNDIFPMKPEDIDAAFEASNGVPREAIRQVITRLDTILFGTRAEPDLPPQDDYVVKLTANVVVGAIIKGLTLAADSKGIEVSLHVASGNVGKQATAIVLVKHDSVEHFIGIDVPNVKDWNRSGGVGAYYSAKRLNDLIESGDCEKAIMAVPEETSGAKFESLSEELGEDLFTLLLDEESAMALVKITNSDQLTPNLSEFFNHILTNLFEISEEN